MAVTKTGKLKRAKDYEAEEKAARVDRALVVRAKTDDGPEGDIARDMLAKRGALRTQLALAEEAGDIESMKEVAAFASALQKGAKVRGLGIEAENEAAEVVIRAERSIGLTIAQMRDAGLLAKHGVNQRGPSGSDGPLQLADIGLPNSGAAIQGFRLLASLSDADFESVLAARRAENERIAKVDFYRLARDYGRPVEAAAAIQQLIREDEGPGSAFVGFRREAAALNMTLLTTDELVELAAIIQSIVAAYKAERARRTA